MDSLTIKLEESLSKEMKQAMKPYYATKTEFVREAIRDKLKSIQKEKALEELRKHFGKAKKKTTQSEERKIRKEAGILLAKKYGVELD